MLLTGPVRNLAIRHMSCIHSTRSRETLDAWMLRANLHYALGLLQGALFWSASLRRILQHSHIPIQTSRRRRSDNATDCFLSHRQRCSRDAICLFTFCMPVLLDLICAMELLLVLKAVFVLFLFGYKRHCFMDLCLCLITRDRQRSAQT